MGMLGGVVGDDGPGAGAPGNTGIPVASRRPRRPVNSSGLDAATPVRRNKPLPRRPIGERAMTDAERQARRYARKEEKIARWKAALERIRTARMAREARAIAEAALAEKPPEE